MTTIGSSARLRATIRDADNALANPVDIVLTYRSPSGVETAVAKAAMSNPSVGVWRYDTPALTEGGTWTYRFVATTPTVTYEDTFYVEPAAIPGQSDRLGPCQPWCSPSDLTRGGWTAPAALTTDDLLVACAAASEVCWELGGRRWPGLCWDSILPQACSGGYGFPLVLPDGRAGMTQILAESGLGGYQRTQFHPHGPCTNGTLIDLQQANVTAIDAIRVDGTALAAADYRLIDHRWVARLDGDAFPTWNPPDATTIALAVDFTYGDSPPAVGFLASVDLARELAKGLAQEDCAIDPRVTSLVREGLSLSLADVGADTDFLEISSVRRFVAAVNPHKLQRAASVTIPGHSSWPSRI